MDFCIPVIAGAQPWYIVLAPSAISAVVTVLCLVLGFRYQNRKLKRNSKQQLKQLKHGADEQRRTNWSGKLIEMGLDAVGDSIGTLANLEGMLKKGVEIKRALTDTACNLRKCSAKLPPPLVEPFREVIRRSSDVVAAKEEDRDPVEPRFLLDRAIHQYQDSAELMKLDLWKQLAPEILEASRVRAHKVRQIEINTEREMALEYERRLLRAQRRGDSDPLLDAETISKEEVSTARPLVMYGPSGDPDELLEGDQ